MVRDAWEAHGTAGLIPPDNVCTLVGARNESQQEDAATRPPVPPFDEETIRKKVKAAEDGWNTRDPEKVVVAYTEDSE